MYKFLTHTILFAGFMFSLNLFGQEKTVTGKIISSEDKLGIIGATVKTKGPVKKSATTDFDGNFKITVNSTDTLEFSAISMISQSIAVGRLSVINVTLSPEKINLKELVVTGYGTLKKANVSSSISSMKGEDIKNIPVYGIDQAMQGRLPGVQVAAASGAPGAPLTVRIRGTGTINNSDPLYVVDGQQMPDVSSLNPGDIERIDVLKDASACAIYGTQGANGVVLITTKKGKFGANKSVLNFDTYYGMQYASHVPKVTNASEYAHLKNELYRSRFYGTGTPQSVINAGLPFQDSAISGTNWWNEVLRPAPMQSYQLSASGGNEFSTYMISGSYLKQDGIIKNTSYDRYTLRVNTEQKVFKNYISIGENLNISYSRRKALPDNSEYDGEWMISAMDPTVPVYDPNPDPDKVTRYGNAQWQAGNYNDVPNPVGVLERRNELTQDMPINGNGWLSLKPIKGLELRSTINVNTDNNDYYMFSPRYFESATSNQEFNNIQRSMWKSRGWGWTNTASYEKTIRNHEFKLLLGGEKGKWSGYQVNTKLDHVPDNANYWYHETTPVDSLNKVLDNYPDHGSTQSVFGRINYAFKGTYLLEANIRRDGSSVFGDNYKYGAFPSFSLGWNVTNEKFMKKYSFISDLKIRGGWGKLGNSRIPSFRYLPSLVSGKNNYTFGTNPTIYNGSTSWGPSNPSLHWESTTTTNFGIDVSLWKNKIQFTADVFNRKTTDMLVAVPTPGIVGAVDPAYANAGSMNNKGYELDLSYRKFEGQFHYSVSMNFSQVRNKLISLGEGVQPISSGTSGRLSAAVQYTNVGYPIASFYGYKTDGLFQNWTEVNESGQPGARPGDIRYKDLNNDGKIDGSDITYLGSPFPKFTYGFNFNLDYKGFDFFVFFQGEQGKKIWNLTRYYLYNIQAGYNVSTDVLDAWTPENTNTNIPAINMLSSNGNISKPSDFYLENGSYLRCKTMQLGYTLPKKYSDIFKITKLRAYISVQNLFTITKYKGADPEMGVTKTYDSGGKQLNIGVDYGNYPVSRTIIAGLNLTL